MAALRNALGALLLTVSPIFADPPSAISGDAAPQSIWQSASDGVAVHLQSGLRCPIHVGDYQRTRTTAFNPSGLDVSCNYVDPAQNVVTMYLTRRSTTTVADDFKEAQRELLAVTPSALPLPDTGQKDVASNFAWTRLIYAEKNGYVHSGIWIADLDGWTLEFRATYVASAEQNVLAEMALLADEARTSAGPGLAICAKSAVPTRKGVAITDKDQIQSITMMATLFGATAQGAMSDPGAKTEPVRSIQWCAEGLVPGFDKLILLWHGAFEDGSDASADRVTPITVGEPPILLSAPDPIMSIAEGEIDKNGSEKWIVSLRDGKKTWIFALYGGRPDGAALASLMNDILDHKARSIGGYSTDGKSIDIEMPGKD